MNASRNIKVEAALKAAHAKEDEFTELFEKAHQYKINVGNGTGQLLDQVFAAHEAEEKTRS